MGARLRPRSWFPGYTVAAVSTVAMTATAPGQTMLLSLLNQPLRDDLGLDPFTLNATYTAATMAAAVPLVWVGRATDRWGPRRMMMAAALALGLACSVLSAASTGAGLALGFFLVRLTGQGSLALTSQHALAMWFHARLGTIGGLITVATFALWTPLPALVQSWIAAYGWRPTWRGLGFVVAFGVATLAALALRNRPEELGLTVDGAAKPTGPSTAIVEAAVDLQQAVRTGTFWRLTSAAALSAAVGTGVLFDLQPLLVGRGVDPSDAAWAVGAWGLTMALLALPAGRAVDRVSAPTLLTLGCTALATGTAILIVAHALVPALAALGCLAAGQSVIVAAVGAEAARAFGRTHHGAIRSAMSRLTIVATGVGPLAFGWSQRSAGSHGPALTAFAGVGLLAAAFNARGRGAGAPPGRSRR
ncbi:MAG: MFS transporter [Myxococcota bacterium]